MVETAFRRSGVSEERRSLEPGKADGALPRRRYVYAPFVQAHATCIDDQAKYAEDEAAESFDHAEDIFGGTAAIDASAIFLGEHSAFRVPRAAFIDVQAGAIFDRARKIDDLATDIFDHLVEIDASANPARSAISVLRSTLVK